MSKRSSRKIQVARDKLALKKLVSSGLYTGKPDYRRTPTPYQKRLISRHADVLAGRAAVVRPKNPATYKAAGFKVAPGGRVIVPRAKGETIGLSQTGKITRTRMTRSGRRKRTIIPAGKSRAGRGPLPAPAAGTALVYYLPFRRGSGKGQTIEWKRFSHAGLVRFFLEYDRTPKQVSDWMRQVEIEEMPADYERELDRFISGEAAEPSTPLPHADERYRRGKRSIKREHREERGEE